jgi:hypothetical protein
MSEHVENSPVVDAVINGYSSMFTPVVETRVKLISDPSSQGLQNKINDFLSNNDVEVIDTNLTVSIKSLYFTITYNQKVERV